ncbi:Vps62-related protein [Pseudomonas sp. C1C7]|uniref:Vps62-related protein n=1 Tax=Pseudomonas sp. C1C7 TaxID=2735272 RepID=UPI001586D651|nr:Vps62-related protein [Pseudomonas sp. C1C7]NUT75082.1 Vps62-related protein [Pseudomonas sp. C1C7]
MQTRENAPSPTGQKPPIKLGNLLINFTTEFHRIWDSKGSDSKPGSFWRPTPAPDALPGYFPLGDFAAPGFDNINGKIIVAVVCEGPAEDGDTSPDKALSAPDDFERVWKDSSSGADADCTVWRPIPPAGYVAMGMVCSNGRDKPLTNTVRCVREDLVVASSVSREIWSDSGSGASQDFSAWAIEPPSAEAGEIYFSPGTFIGVKSHGRPAANTAAYSLRAPIPMHIDTPPARPILLGHESPAPEEPAILTQTAHLPWFTVIDPALAPLEQFRTSPFYRLQRSDRYVLVGHGHNTGTTGQTFKWTAPRAQRMESLEAFTEVTTIRVSSEWPLYVSNPMALHTLLSSSMRFSAKLGKAFTHTETSHIGWTTSAAVEVITRIAKKTSLAVHVIESGYRLLREDGTQVANDVLYTDIDSLSLSEYPPETEEEAPAPAQPAVDPVVTDSAP